MEWARRDYANGELEPLKGAALTPAEQEDGPAWPELPIFQEKPCNNNTIFTLPKNAPLTRNVPLKMTIIASI